MDYFFLIILLQDGSYPGVEFYGEKNRENHLYNR